MVSFSFYARSAVLAMSAAAFLAAAAGDARAQVPAFDGVPSVTAAPAAPAVAPTPPESLALLYHRLSGQQPDFRAWAQLSADYLAAEPLDKEAVLARETADLRNAFRLTTVNAPLTVVKTVKLSPYSAKNKGYTVESFSNDVYFPFDFAGKSYALILPRLADEQWISVAPDKTAAIESALSPAREIGAVLTVSPTFADKSKPLRLGGADRWLMSGRVTRLRLMDEKTGSALFDRTDKQAGPLKADPAIVDLYGPPAAGAGGPP